MEDGVKDTYLNVRERYWGSCNLAIPQRDMRDDIDPISDAVI